MLVDNLGQAVRTQLVDGLLADLLQAVRFLCVYRKLTYAAKRTKPHIYCLAEFSFVLSNDNSWKPGIHTSCYK